MLNSNSLIAFVATTDIVTARDFYENVLGLLLTYESPEACVFDVNGTMLRLTPVREKEDTSYTVLGWDVDDITATIEGLVERGVVFERYNELDQDDLGIWTTPHGDGVAWFRDPDCNILSLTQFAV